jgi:hypothetical protein
MPRAFPFKKGELHDDDLDIYYFLVFLSHPHSEAFFVIYCFVYLNLRTESQKESGRE